MFSIEDLIFKHLACLSSFSVILFRAVASSLVFSSSPSQRLAYNPRKCKKNQIKLQFLRTIFIVLPLSRHYKYPNQLLSSNLSWTFSHSRVEVKILVQYYLNVLCFRICKYSCHSKKSTPVGFPSWQYPQEWQQWQLLKKVEVIEVRSEMF